MSETKYDDNSDRSRRESNIPVEQRGDDVIHNGERYGNHNIYGNGERDVRQYPESDDGGSNTLA